MTASEQMAVIKKATDTLHELFKKEFVFAIAVQCPSGKTFTISNCEDPHYFMMDAAVLLGNVIIERQQPRGLRVIEGGRSQSDKQIKNA